MVRKKHRGQLSELLWVIYEEKSILYKKEKEKNCIYKSIRYIFLSKIVLFVQDFGTTSSYLWHEWDIKSCRIFCDVTTFEYSGCSYLRKEQVIKPYSSMWDVRCDYLTTSWIPSPGAKDYAWNVIRNMQIKHEII